MINFFAGRGAYGSPMLGLTMPEKKTVTTWPDALRPAAGKSVVSLGLPPAAGAMAGPELLISGAGAYSQQTQSFNSLHDGPMQQCTSYICKAIINFIAALYCTWVRMHSNDLL